jgi:energy-coupling factor transport system substrate-specific component
LDKRLTIREITLFGMLAALTFGAKWIMAGLPNIEPVSLMVMIFGAVFGWKALFPVAVYVTAEILFYGLGTWNINYLYVWPILALAACFMRKQRHPLYWALLSGVFGLLFGALCTPVDLAIGGIGYAVSKWVSGIPFDLTHCAGNFVIALLLFKPIRDLTEKLYRNMMQ